MKVLIVEDDAGLRESLQEILELQGHQVLAAEDGVQGLALAAQLPDFIFCDVDMPRLDGHAMLAEIRKLPRVCDVPFVFLTGRGERDDLRQGMVLGADDYITKPFTAADILGAIAARIKRQGKLIEQIQALAARQEREINAQWSHELLTPLNAVLGSLDLIELEADTISRAELKEMLSLIRQGAERQERLSRKLISYFSLEQMVNSTAPSAVGRCAGAVAVAFGAGQAARRHQRESDVAVTTGPGEVALPERWLAIAVEELVDNAAIFSPVGSPITVTGVAGDGQYRISVTDQGPGLSAEQRGHVGAFTQFDRRKREQQGLGLGLTIARLAARLAGGELALSDGPGGHGLRVDVRIPLV